MKIIIIGDEEKNKEGNAIDTLYEIRSEELECRLKEREIFIKENHLKDVTYDDILKELDKIPNVDNKLKERIMDLLGKLLDNRLEIQNFDCKLYYRAGIKDAINIIVGNEK